MNGEELSQSFNASSIISSSYSYSSFANADIHKAEIDDSISSFNLKKQDSTDFRRSVNSLHLNSEALKRRRQILNQVQDQKSAEEAFINFNSCPKILEDDCISNLKQFDREIEVFSRNFANQGLISIKDKEAVEINYNLQQDLNDSNIQRIDEDPEDSFEASFYSAFKIQSNNNYIELNEHDDFNKALNEYSNNSKFSNLIQKSKSLAQILNKLHVISQYCTSEIDSNSYCQIMTEEYSKMFKEIWQKLNFQENDLRNILRAHLQNGSWSTDQLNQSKEQELMKELTGQIELLMRLIQVNKLKLKLFKRAMPTKT